MLHPRAPASRTARPGALCPRAAPGVPARASGAPRANVGALVAAGGGLGRPPWGARGGSWDLAEGLPACSRPVHLPTHAPDARASRRALLGALGNPSISQAQDSGSLSAGEADRFGGGDAMRNRCTPCNGSRRTPPTVSPWAREESANAVPRALDARLFTRVALSSRTPSRHARRSPERKPSGNQGRKDEAPEAGTLGASLTDPRCEVRKEEEMAPLL